jgi:hypothetical protein
MAMCTAGHRYTRTTRHGRCPVCARDKQRYADDPHRQALSSYAWHKVRAAARRRDGNCCRLEGEDCFGRLQVHHVGSVRRGGNPFELSNLLTVCRHHHEVLERETRKRHSERLILQRVGA